MGLFSNLFGGGKLKKASKKAAAEQTAAMQQGIAQQQDILSQIGGYYQPYQQFGAATLGQYGDLLGTNGPEAQAAAMQALRESPYFKSLYGQGQEAILQNASATGGLRGGNTQHSLYDLGEQTFAQTIENQLSHLMPGVNMGYGTAGALSGAAQNTGNNITDLLVGQGQVKAQDILTRGAISNSLWSGLGSLGLSALGAAIGIPGLGQMNPGAASAGMNPTATNPFSGFNFGGIFGGGNAAVGMGQVGGGYIPSPELAAAMPLSMGATSPLTSLTGGFSTPGAAY